MLLLCFLYVHIHTYLWQILIWYTPNNVFPGFASLPINYSYYP